MMTNNDTTTAAKADCYTMRFVYGRCRVNLFNGYDALSTHWFNTIEEAHAWIAANHADARPLSY